MCGLLSGRETTSVYNDIFICCDRIGRWLSQKFDEDTAANERHD